MFLNSNYTECRKSKFKIMAASSSNSYLTSNHEVVNINKNKEFKLRTINQNGQIHIYQSSYRGCYSSIVRDSLRNAALGRKVLLVQLMKGDRKSVV